MQNTKIQDWIDLKYDQKTGLETIHAHFSGHAYDPHWHDSYLIGVTEQGVQQFNCRHEKQISHPGTSFLLEPGEIHDGDAPSADGFTYRLLSLDPEWLRQQTCKLFDDTPDTFELSVDSTLSQDPLLTTSIFSAFSAIHYQEPKIVKDACIDRMIERVTSRIYWRRKQKNVSRLHCIALKGQEYLHANVYQNIGLDDLSRALDIDRFKMTRAFKSVFGIAPHAYLIQLRLVEARALLSKGISPVDVSNQLCFSDQSHMGRWFKRCYQLTPSNYQKCTNLPELY